MKQTSDNQVNIQMKLCVHPNIVSKGTKAWIKRSSRVVTWLGYKRKDISRTIEFKGPSIREHSFYSHSTDKFTIIPLLLNTNFGVKTWYTVILTTYFSFFFFSDEWFKVTALALASLKFPSYLEFHCKYEMSPKHKGYVKQFRSIIYLFTNHT